MFPKPDATIDMTTFLERLTARMQKYLSRFFCLHGSIAVTYRPGNDTSQEEGLRKVGLVSHAQSQGFEFHWQPGRSMKLKVRVAEAAPPEGYLKLLNVLRREIQQ